MNVRFAWLSTQGKVRSSNEDYLVCWESKDPLVREKQGGLALLADGVGGSDFGGLASKVAVEEALRVFQESPPVTDPSALLRKMFSEACAKVYETSIREKEGRS